MGIAPLLHPPAPRMLKPHDLGKRSRSPGLRPRHHGPRPGAPRMRSGNGGQTEPRSGTQSEQPPATVFPQPALTYTDSPSPGRCDSIRRGRPRGCLGSSVGRAAHS